MPRLAQRHVTVVNQIVYPPIAQRNTRKPTERHLAVRGIESDPRWGWLELACETTTALVSHARPRHQC